MSLRTVFGSFYLFWACLVLGLVPAAQAQVGVFQVNSNGDASDINPGDDSCETGGTVGGQPECTLRAAIEEGNAKVGVDFIIPHPFIATDANGFVRIQPQSPYPPITESTILDMDGAPGYDDADPFATPIIQIDGSQAGAGADGLVIQGAGAYGTTVVAVAIHGFGGRGIVVTADEVSLIGNQIGVADGQTAAGNGGHGVWIGGPNAVVGRAFNPNNGWVQKGNVISDNGGYGVLLNDDDALVAGNRIGTDPSGTTAMGNAFYGVGVIGDRNSVGAVGTLTAGGDVGMGNVIADSSYGIGIFTPSVDTTVEANFVGTDASGTTALPNQAFGIYVAADDVTIGSVGAGSNLVSGNATAGIFVEQPSALTTGVIIRGNRIGVSADESMALPNGLGIFSLDALAIFIESNVIGGNTSHGVQANGYQAILTDNFVGTNSVGADLGNGGDGVHLVDATSSIVGSSFHPPNTISFNGGHGVYLNNTSDAVNVYGNQIGSATPGEGAGNGGDGIHVDSSSIVQVFLNEIGENAGNAVTIVGGASSLGNPIVANAMFDNGGIGVDLGGDGATPNDVGDSDTGENGLQNTPVFDPQFTTYNASTGQIEVRYRVDTNLGEATYPLRIDFFLADSGGDEGEVWLGPDSYPAVSAGSFRSFAFTPPAGPDYASETLLATVLNGDNDSSEFSAPVPLPEPGAPIGLVCGAGLLAALARRRRDG